MMMLQTTPDPRHVTQRFESDRDSLPFPTGGVFGRPASPTPGAGTPTPDDDLACQILRTIDSMQASLDTLERAMGDELERELNELGDVVARIRASSDDHWPPAAA